MLNSLLFPLHSVLGVFRSFHLPSSSSLVAVVSTKVCTVADLRKGTAPSCMELAACSTCFHPEQQYSWLTLFSSFSWLFRMWCRRLACLLSVPCQHTRRHLLGLSCGRRTFTAAVARWHHTAPESLSCAWQLHGDHLGRCVLLSLFLGLWGKRSKIFPECVSPVVIPFWNNPCFLERCVLELVFCVPFGNYQRQDAAGLSAGSKSFIISEAVLTWKVSDSWTLQLNLALSASCSLCLADGMAGWFSVCPSSLPCPHLQFFLKTLIFETE